MEIPQEEIAQAVEEAAAIPVEEDDVPMEDDPQPEADHDEDVRMDDGRDEDTRTVADSEMELDVDEDTGEDPEDVSSRQPVLLFDTEFHVDQALAHVKLSLQVLISVHIESAYMVDSAGNYARYVAFMIVNYMYKSWRGNTRWLEIPFNTMKDMFNAHK